MAESAGKRSKMPNLTLLDPNKTGRQAMAISEVIGSSASFMAVLESVRTVAPAPCAVLIRGETGTGKEVIARAIHEVSTRRQHRFVAINCAAIPAALLESELFGYERGAFTGAMTQRMGRFQAAHLGTLFLDEIGELPIELQPKLLRAIQEQEFERLGSSQTTRVDVRIVAATNQNLEQMIAERRFRIDLYYRLNVFPIMLPPLRERADDIPFLVDHFVRKCAEQQGKFIERVPDDVMAALTRYDWPGNIRELQNFIERSVILTRGAELRAPVEELLNNEVFADNSTLADADKAHIIDTLRKTSWVVGGKCGAASRLGLKRTTLIHKMRKLGISREIIEQGAGLSDAEGPMKRLSLQAIRELQKIIERVMIISKSRVFNAAPGELELDATPSSYQAETKATPPEQRNLDDLLDETERAQIVSALEASNGVVGGPSGAATRLGIKRSTLQLRMQRLGIRLSPFSRTALTESQRTAG
jgi:transcriptional regulator with GAF, ATPase, and Fis domain